MANFAHFKELIHSADMSFKVDMVKAATKNYLKLTKKFLQEGIFVEPSKTV